MSLFLFIWVLIGLSIATYDYFVLKSIGLWNIHVWGLLNCFGKGLEEFSRYSWYLVFAFTFVTVLFWPIFLFKKFFGEK